VSVRRTSTVIAVTAVAASVAATGFGMALPAKHPKRTEIESIHTTAHGTILATRNDRVVYLFKKDTRNHSNCGAECRSFWPPVMSAGKPEAEGSVSQHHLARTPEHQVTYHGHPLYHYSGDTRAGEASGEGLSAFGARWYVVSPHGKAVKH
jgi:predicted lipoprotein with Yx(FWY)xxD motif